MKILIVCAVLLGVISCGKGGDLLHHVIPKPPPKTLEFTHKVKELQGNDKLDILWTIDNSGSMGQYQKDVIANTEIFIDEFVKFGHVDWKMGLLSTDSWNSFYLGFSPTTQLTFQTPQAPDVFKDAVRRLGTSGSGTEKAFETNRKAVDEHPDFFRKKAVLALIFVTDAREQSNIPAQEMITLYTKMKGNLDNVILYGVFGARDFGCISTGGEESWNYAGSPYETLVKATQGFTYTLCKDDFGKILAAIGKDLVTRLETPKVRLTVRPVVETIRVYHKGNLLPGGPEEDGGYWLYDFDLNALVFHNLDFAPDENEEIAVSFKEAETQAHQ